MPPKRASQSGKNTRKKPVSGNVKAGTLYPVGRLNRLLKEARLAERTSSSAGAFMAGVLEYLTAEILELAGDVCEQSKKKTISPKHINLGIRNDEEFQKLIHHVTIAAGSVPVRVHEDL